MNELKDSECEDDMNDELEIGASWRVMEGKLLFVRG